MLLLSNFRVILLAIFGGERRLELALCKTFLGLKRRSLASRSKQ